MHATHLCCPRCRWETELKLVYSCERCGFSLDVRYDYDSVDKSALKAAFSGGRLWSFRELLPLSAGYGPLTLLEGGTPLLPSVSLGKSFGFELLFKDETRNPTASFKDRPNTVGISMARQFGAKAVAIASTGNGAASISAYAARGGMPCYVFVPEHTSASKLLQIRSHGAELVLTPGDYSASFAAAQDACLREGWANMTSTYLNPYTMEGDKTIAYELFSRLEGRVPDWIIVPLGAGAMLTGVYKGYRELQALGFVSELPRMCGVQASGCAPITRAWEENLPEVLEWENCETVAHAIADPLTGYAKDGTRTLTTIRESNGCGITAPEDDIIRHAAMLARKEGLYVEAGAASASAAAELLYKKGLAAHGQTVVAIITGHGLKENKIIGGAPDESKG
ncbi:MAG: threonine synthase [Oscillospiraceae bacterium]|nr:threonine synthase [Oscillospiraceae bacterium]